MEKKFIVIALAALICTWANAQKKSGGSFKLPKNAEYSKGTALVKVNANFKSFFSSSSGRTQGLPIGSVTPLVPPIVSQRNANGRSQAPVVDITSYYKITFNPDQNIEEQINQLYATGYFEIVEPDYVYKSHVVPSDPSAANQYHLQTIKAYQAWDIKKGSDNPSVVIAIIDSGGDLDHPDLKDNLYTNPKEIASNGIDDDKNGYIDDVQGWDFVGSDTLNAFKTDFVGDNDVRVTKGGDVSHGTWTAGCASATTNNGIGIAGVAYNTKLLFTKHSGDNQKTTSGSVYSAYSGVLYAANQGIKIINCSFGGTSRSQIIQDVINHIVLDLGCLVVASAGNDNSSDSNYPAAYDNVVSVSATDKDDKKASFSNYGSTVDIAAPGVSILTTGYKSVYNTESGTSFSSPIVAGAAALVWAKNPSFTPQQVAEQLRVSSDETALNTANPSFAKQIGKGRLDIQRALTLELPSIRASNSKLLNASGLAAQPGDKALLTFNFTNFLKSTSSGLQISISTSSSNATITKASVSPGSIAGNATVSNNLTPFELTISSNAAEDASVDILITYSDGSYTDYQYASFLVNRSFIDVDKNTIATTMTSIGRIGYADAENTTRLKGSGFNFDNSSMLYEMGLIMGTDSTLLYNNVRGAKENFDQDFTSVDKIKEIVPGSRSYDEVFGSFKNSSTKVSITYRSLVWKQTPYDKFIILEYKVKNTTTAALNKFHFGIFADWDITTNGAEDAADWDNNTRLGYVYPATSAAKPIGGIQVLTGTPEYYAIDNLDANAGSSSFGLYNSTAGSFTKAEKFKSISSGLGRLQSGKTTTKGNDVSHVVSSGPYNIGAGEEITLAFALHAGKNLTDLKASAVYADSLYNYTLKATRPLASDVSVCYGKPATLNASGASTMKWYKNFTGGDALVTGSQFITGNLLNDTTLFVSNADKSYESVRTPVKVSVKSNPAISSSGATSFCEGQSITLSVADADSYLWNTGATTKTIQVAAAGNYSVTVKNTALSCQSISSPVVVKVNSSPVAKFTIPSTLPVIQSITFTDQSTNAVSWFWDFGDGSTSILQNPTHSYTSDISGTVKLKVTASNGCTSSISNPLSVITGVEEVDFTSIKAYPNPINNETLKVEIPASVKASSIHLMSPLGQSLFEQALSSNEKLIVEIPVSALPVGLYLLRVKVQDGFLTQKVMKMQ